MGPDSSFAWKGDFFGENWLTLLSLLRLPIVLHYATMSQKILADHEIQDVLVLGQIGHKSPTYPYRGFFFKKIDVYFCLLQIPYHNTVMIKKNY